MKNKQKLEYISECKNVKEDQGVHEYVQFSCLGAKYFFKKTTHSHRTHNCPEYSNKFLKVVYPQSNNFELTSPYDL